MKKRKKKLGDYLYYLIVIILLGVITISLYKVVPYMWNKYTNNKEHENLQNEVIVFEPEIQEEEPKEEYELYEIDFDALHKINSKIVGWIRFDNQKKTPIDYPVIYAADNDAYLRTSIYKKYSIAGSIFIEEKDDADLIGEDDMTTIIYGHNMRDDTMFGSLQEYRYSEDFYKENQYFTIYTPEAIYRYQIFSCFVTEGGTPSFYTLHQKDSEKYQEYIDYVCKNSLINTGIVPTTDQHIVMLSTCAESNSPRRTTVYGVLTKVTEVEK